MRTSLRLLVLALGTIVLTGLVMSCAEYPPLRYYEMDDAIANAETKEERDYYLERQRYIENEVEKADQFIQMLDLCSSTSRCMATCIWKLSPGRKDLLDLDKNDLSDIEKKYKWWMRVRPPTCGFQTDW